MIKCKVVEKFSLNDFDKLQNVVRANANLKENGKLYVNDEFECDDEMAKYLTGGNSLKKVVVKVVEVIPEINLTHGDIIKENIIPLDEENLKTIAEQINNTVKKTTKKKKSKK